MTLYYNNNNLIYRQFCKQNVIYRPIWGHQLVWRLQTTQVVQNAPSRAESDRRSRWQRQCHRFQMYPDERNTWDIIWDSILAWDANVWQILESNIFRPIKTWLCLLAQQTLIIWLSRPTNTPKLGDNWTKASNYWKHHNYQCLYLRNDHHLQL